VVSRQPQEEGELAVALAIKQQSTYKGDDWWDWSVWVDGTDAELSKVKSVTYRLHETFVEPVQIRKTRRNKFRLDSAGWGEFTIVVKIDIGEGKPIVKRHYLTLERTTTRALAAQPASIYLCYAASDKRIALELEKILTAASYKVLNASQIPGSSFRVALAESLKAIDAVVAIISGEPSEWVLFEIGLAQGASVPVVLAVEAKSELPPPLAKFSAVEFISQSAMSALSITPDLESAIGRAVKRRKR
jgi:hypothetical protein